jgi:hypothetical protein
MMFIMLIIRYLQIYSEPGYICFFSIELLFLQKIETYEIGANDFFHFSSIPVIPPGQ